MIRGFIFISILSFSFILNATPSSLCTYTTTNGQQKEGISFTRKYSKPICLGPYADLRGAYLRGMNLQHLDLSGSNFERADVEHAIFDHSVLMGANFKEALGYKASFVNTNLIGANFDGGSFVQANFAYADLSKGSIRGTYLHDANLSETYLVRTSYNDKTALPDNFTPHSSMSYGY